MTGLREAIRLGIVLGAVSVAGCGAPTLTPTPGPSLHTGGTLRIGVADQSVENFVFANPGLPIRGELLRCCLARTPLTYPGQATADGGAALIPDLALELPEISADGLSWTITLRQGIRYSPPYETLSVTSSDIVRAMERAARLNPEISGIGGPLSVIAGAAQFAAGEASVISGLETPDDLTLVVRLVAPTGDYSLLADPVTAPIPADLAIGHDEDLRYRWASTGPYMFETYPGDPAATLVALIRNPSWDRASDPRRQAWVDRIEVSKTDDLATALALVASGEIDLLDRPATAEVTAAYRTDPQRSHNLRSTPIEALFWLPMNLAVPPFDDVHVRRAANLAINRAELRDLVLAARTEQQGPQMGSDVSAHVFPDSVSAGLLLSYDPLDVGAGTGDANRAQEEMAKSRHDTDGDGMCDATVCRGILMPSDDLVAGESIRAALAAIGIDIVPVPKNESNAMEYAANRTAIQANLFGWGFGLSGTDLGALLRGGPQLSELEGGLVNYSLLGAPPDYLAQLGYGVTDVPSVDDLLDRCLAAIGRQRQECWAEVDQLLTESLIPWIPLFHFEAGHVVSARVDQFQLDQSLFGAFPAIDQLSLLPDV